MLFVLPSASTFGPKVDYSVIILSLVAAFSQHFLTLKKKKPVSVSERNLEAIIICHGEKLGRCDQKSVCSR